MGQLFKVSTMCFLGAVLLTRGISSAGADYPATFQIGKTLLSTLEQYSQRVRSIHPELEIHFKPGESVNFKNQTYDSLVVTAIGVEKGTKFDQELTYIKWKPGLWRMVYLVNKVCVWGEAIGADQKWEEGWKCKEDIGPLSGFADIYLAQDQNVATEILEEVFAAPVVRVKAVAKGSTSDPKPSLMTLGDLRQSLSEVGSETSFENATYYDLKDPLTPHKAIKIRIQGQLDSLQTVDQTFLYVIQGENLKLKEIDGQICRYVERVSKEICDPIYTPTPVSSVPLEMINSGELSDYRRAIVQVKEQAQPELSCGSLPTHYGEILKIHFQRSAFDIQSTKEVVRVIENLPKAVDPMGLFFSSQEKQKMVSDWKNSNDFDVEVEKLVKAMNSGKNGDCFYLGKLVEDVQKQVLGKSSEVLALLKKVQDSDKQVFSASQISVELSEYEQRILPFLNQRLDPTYSQVSERQATDVLMQKIEHYCRDMMQKVNDFEEFVISAMAMQDAYSQALVQAEVAEASLTGRGRQNDKYFGVSVETGASGRHYFARIHPDVQARLGLQAGQEIVSINGVPARDLTYKEVDAILIDTSRKIDLDILSNSGLSPVELVAQPLDPLDFFYEVELRDMNGENWIYIDLKSFEMGVTSKILEKAREILARVPVVGFILDLRNNPGGTTDEAFNVVSLFVKNRIFAYSRIGQRNFARLRTHVAKEEFFLDDSKPLIVRVNSQSMSSSEIVASSLKALGRSVTVGWKTFGKFVRQHYLPVVLGNKKPMGLLLTATEFYNVDGEALNSIGLEPDFYEGVQGEHLIFEDGIGQGENVDAKDLEDVQKYHIDFSIENYLDSLFSV